MLLAAQGVFGRSLDFPCLQGVRVKARFGDIRFDSDTRQLSRESRELHVSGKAFELLKLLLERRPNAVSKGDIQDYLWPDTFVSETNLPSLVTELRDAIGDDARHPSFIRTLHGFGYAFSGEVTDETRLDNRPSGLEPPAAWLMWEGRRIPLSEGENVLGREGEGVTAFDSTMVSRVHARIVIRNQKPAIEDLGSKNGTFVNDVLVTSATPLADGDQIRMGDVLLRFRLARPSMSTETQGSNLPFPAK